MRTKYAGFKKWLQKGHEEGEKHVHLTTGSQTDIEKVQEWIDCGKP